MSGRSGSRGPRIRWVDILDRPDLTESALNSLPAGIVVKLISGLRAALISGAAGVTVDNGDGSTGQIVIRLNAEFAAFLNALIGQGFPARTGTGTWALRQLVQPAAGITIANPQGIAGNPTFALANDLAALEALASTGLAARIAANTWAQRSIAKSGDGLAVSNGSGVAGNPTLALADDAAALEALATTGFAARIAANTWALRQLALSAAMDAIASVTNPAGVAGNPTLGLDNQNANLVFAGPASGAAAAPTFRGLEVDDLPEGVEGTFTPGFTFATPGDLSVSYALQSGNYTRIGNRVWFSLLVSLTPTFSTASGVLRVTNLPITFVTPNPRLLVAITSGQISYNGRTHIIALGVAGQTYCQIGAYASNQAAVGITAAEVTSGNPIDIAISGSYAI